MIIFNREDLTFRRIAWNMTKENKNKILTETNFNHLSRCKKVEILLIFITFPYISTIFQCYFYVKYNI